jgi:hypothetical protein
MIEAEEVLRLTYRMTGEVYEPKKVVKGKRKPLTAPNTWNAGTPAAAEDSKSDPSDPKETTPQ